MTDDGAVSLEDREAVANEQETDESVDDRAHLDGLEQGAGCAEIWEHLSERRDAGSD